VRLYTLQEARALLPRIIPVLEEIRGAFLRLRGLQAAIAADSRSVQADGHLLADPFEATEGEDRLAQLQEALREGARKLSEWGVELKDPERGLIDFYHERDGETIFLCYHLGEPSIRYWHTLTSGFLGRQRIAD
jgi:hypothetical protein